MANKILFTIFLFLTFQVSTLAQPVVDLGQDTILCGSSLMLDAGNSGATFLWSDGSTTQTIVAGSTGSYWVSVTDVSGTTSDTIEVEFVAIPAQPITPDTSVCGFPELMLSTNATADFTFWTLDSVGTPFLGQGTEIPYQVTGSKALLVQSKNIGGVDSTGFFEPASGPSGNYFSLPTGRGMRFDVIQHSTLESVTVYAQAGSSGSISLTDNLGTILKTSAHVFPNTGANEVYLGYDLVPGLNYRLIIENPVGSFYLITSTSYNFPINQINLKRGQPLNNQYPAFFNWKISDLGCFSVMDTSQVTSIFQPDFDLGNDTILCSQNYTFDISSSGGINYLWSDGSTLATLTVDSSALVWAESENNGCFSRDSINVQILETPSSAGPNDTTICGSGIITLSAALPVANDVTLWYDSALGGNILSQNSSLSLHAKDTTTVYIERLSLPEIDTLGYTDILTAPSGGYFSLSGEKGLVFDVFRPIKLISLDIFSQPENPGSGINASARVVIQDTNGGTIYSQMYEFDKIGRNTVFLNFDLPTGNNYKIVLVDGTGRFYLTFSSSNPFPGEGITIKEGTPLKSQYSYFFNWRTAANVCSSGRIPVTVNVILPNQLQDSIYSCSAMVLNGPTGTNNFSWSTGASTASILADTSQLYTVSASDSLGCNVTYSSYFELPEQVNLGPDGNFCGTEVFSGYGQDASILWSTGDSTPSIILTTPGQYWVEVNEPRGCTLTDTINISSFSQNPVVNIGNDTSVCTSITLNSQFSGLQNFWSTGDTTSILTISASGVYSIVVIDSLGCEGTDTIGIAVTQIPTAGFSLDTTGLTAAFVNSSGFGSYLWDFGDNTTSTLLNPVHTYATAGIYTVRLIASNQCGSDTAEMVIQVDNPKIGLSDLSPSIISAKIRYDQERIPYLYVEAGETELDFRISIYDLFGREVSDQSYSIFPGETFIPLSLAQMVHGVYLVTVETGNYTSSTTFFNP